MLYPRGSLHGLCLVSNGVLKGVVETCTQAATWKEGIASSVGERDILAKIAGIAKTRRAGTITRERRLESNISLGSHLERSNVAWKRVASILTEGKVEIQSTYRLQARERCCYSKYKTFPFL